MMDSCRLCPRSCGAPRGPQAGAGRCGMPYTAHVALADLHMWEEPVISGSRGSGAVFFSGCTLGCVYCQNLDISRGISGEAYTPEMLAQTFRSLERRGAHNLNLVTGTHFIPVIIKAFDIYRPGIPTVWNSSGYESPESIDAIAPYVDIWLPDYKYALAEPAMKYSGAPDYPETALSALKRMRLNQPENIIENGIMKKGMIIRHLVLPLNTRNSIAVLRSISENLPSVPVSLMSQYTPVIRSGIYPELNRRITRREYEKVFAAMLELDLDGLIQEPESSSKAYIPDFLSN